MADAPTDILNASFALADLAKSRNTAIRRYTESEKGITDAHFTLTDGEYLAPLHDAFVKRNDLIKRVIEESEKYFNTLDEPLKFGLREMGKPLVLPVVGPDNPAKVLCLVVKPKPVETKNTALQASAEPAYTYDVQMVDLSGK